MARYALHFFLIFLILLTPLPLQAAQPIVQLEFRGLHRTDEELVRRHLTSLEGTSYSPVKVATDIKALFKTGYFGDVTVEKVELSGGVKLIFICREKGIISSIVFRGNRKIKDKDLLEAIPVRKENLMDERHISEASLAIRTLYEEKGFALIDVGWELAPLDTENNEMELIFTVDENRDLKIKRISFVGNKVFSDRRLARLMKTKVKGLFSFLSGSGKVVDEKLERDLAMLTYFYLNEGYIKVRVGKPQLSMTRNKKAIYITIPLFEGPRYKVGTVDVAGDIITTREELLSKFKLKRGEPYRRSNQDLDVQILTDLYGDQAYAFANIYPMIDTHDETGVADITYRADKGYKIYIERIDITGNTLSRDKVIRRELRVQENAAYSRSGLDLSKRRLMQLGFFEDVNFSTPRGSRDDRVVLVVDVKEKPVNSFSLGAGFSSLESIIFTASVQTNNVLGYGISGGASANISKLRQEFSFQMTDRYFLDSRWIFSTSVYRFFSALNRDFDQKSFGGAVSFGREVIPFVDFSIGYRIEDILVTNFSPLVPAFFQALTGGLTSSATTSLALDRRDNRFFTRKGIYESVSFEWAGKGLGGDNDFWKLYADSRVFLGLPLKMILKARGLFSYANSLADHPVPLFERFFLGGINTLRGYDLNTIGPQLRIPSSETGGDRLFTYGGNRMVVANLEWEVPIYDPAGFRGVAFADAGQAYGEDEAIDLTKFRYDYGFGLRWQSPFGPLRFEWGIPIGKREGESGSVFNFSIGQSF